MSDSVSIPPRVGDLEKEVHTLKHRVSVFENTHEKTPHRLTRLESAFEIIGDIKRSVDEQSESQRNTSEMIISVDSKIDGYAKAARFWAIGMAAGIGMAWGLYSIGPDLLKILGAK